MMDLIGTIIEGPTPDEHGDVTFKVRVGDEVVVGVANPCGVGRRGEITRANLDTTNAAMRAVQQFVKAHRTQMLTLYREAARLRRAAGNPAFAGNTRRGSVRLVGSPTKSASGSFVFAMRAGATEITILLFAEGGFIDHSNAELSDQDRDEAFTVCLDYVFAHPNEAAALGMDVVLLDELWR